MSFEPDKNKDLEVSVDTSFARDWNTLCSEELLSDMPRTGFVIKCISCPIYWTSKLQTEIALSTTESEYIELFHSMRDSIPLLTLIEATKCTVFEDNNGCIELTKMSKITSKNQTCWN